MLSARWRDHLTVRHSTTSSGNDIGVGGRMSPCGSVRGSVDYKCVRLPVWNQADIGLTL